MKLISIDVGLRNFAWCTMQRIESKEECWMAPPFRGSCISVLDWKVIDIVALCGPSTPVNLNDTDISTIVPWFCKALDSHEDSLCPPGLELALIEAQPTGHVLPGGKSISNIKTKVLSHLLQAFFVHRRIPVKFISPACKLRDAKDLMKDASEYSSHKKGATLLTLQCLQTIGGDTLLLFQSLKGKKDDMADAFLQGVCADLTVVEKKPKAKKRPRPNKVMDLPIFED
jgi:hypothetical protein